MTSSSILLWFQFLESHLGELFWSQSPVMVSVQEREGLLLELERFLVVGVDGMVLLPSD